MEKSTSPIKAQNRRSSPVQQRSRATRKKIITAAIKLWNARGFENGFEATTVDEIGDCAGVSRATVYYYFPKKEDILSELAWTTAEQIYELSLKLIMTGEPVERVIDEIMGKLGEMIMKSPPAAIRLLLQTRDVGPDTLARDSDLGGLTRAFSVVISHAQQEGEFSEALRSMEVGEMLSSLAMGCIAKWSVGGDADLSLTLRRRASILLSGARNYEKTTETKMQ